MLTSNQVAELQELARKMSKTQTAVDCAPTPTSSSDPESGISTKEVRLNEQYCRVNSTDYTASGPTTKTLTAGYYTFKRLANGALVYSNSKLITDDLVVLPDTVSETILKEIELFWTKGDKYASFGLSHKRGYMLHGPQGSGKTSTINLAIQNVINMGGVVFDCADTSPHMVTEGLKDFRAIEPTRPCIVLLEDIDSYVMSYNESSVLSILDGESSIDKVVFIASTNYPENLKERLMDRPSRFDRVIKIGMPNPEARRVYLTTRKLELNLDELETWVKDTNNFSIAHIKELIIGVFCLETPYKDVLERLRAMAKPPKSGDGRKSPGGFLSGRTDG